MADTHINAYYAELAIAKSDLAAAQSRVETLKEQITALEKDKPESADGATPAETTAKANEANAKSKPKSKSKSTSKPKVTAQDAPPTPKDADVKPSYVPQQVPVRRG